MPSRPDHATTAAWFLGNMLLEYSTGLGVTTGFYGILCLLFLWSLATFTRPKNSKVTVIMFAGTILTFGVFTAHLVFQTKSFIRFIRGAVMVHPNLQNLDDWLNEPRIVHLDPAPFSLGQFTLLISSAFVIWRMSTLLERLRWSLVVPIILLLTALVFLTLELRFTFDSAGDPVISNWISLLFTFATNILCTFVIGFKLWKRRLSISEKMRVSEGRRGMFRVVLNVIESGLVNVVFQIAGPLSLHDPIMNVNFSIAALYPTTVFLIAQYKMAMADLYELPSSSVSVPLGPIELGNVQTQSQIRLPPSSRRRESVRTLDTLVSETRGDGHDGDVKAMRI